MSTLSSILRGRGLRPVGLSVAATLLLAGVAFAASSEAGTRNSAQTAATPAAKPVVIERSAAKYQIVYIPKNLGNPYFDSIVAGFKKAGKALNYDVRVVGPAQAGATDQIPFIDAAVRQRVDAIAISPNDPDAVVPSLKKAMAAGIKVIAVNSDMNPAGRQVAILPVDFTKLGRYLVELQGGLMGYKGTFAILSATSTAPDQNVWIEGMKATLKSNAKYKNMKLVDVVYGDDAPAKSFTEAMALLTKYPTLGGITSPTTVGVAAAAQVVSASNRKGKLALTGLGTPNQMRKYVKDGTVKKFALWDPAAEGYLAGYLLVGMINGKIDPKAGTTFAVPGRGKATITKNTQIITGPPFEFTKANIGGFNF